MERNTVTMTVNDLLVRNALMPLAQRGEVWRDSDVSDLRDSIISGLHIGIMTYADIGGRWYCLDGQQRRAALVEITSILTAGIQSRRDMLTGQAATDRPRKEIETELAALLEEEKTIQNYTVEIVEYTDITMDDAARIFRAVNSGKALSSAQRGKATLTEAMREIIADYQQAIAGEMGRTCGRKQPDEVAMIIAAAASIDRGKWHKIEESNLGKSTKESLSKKGVEWIYDPAEKWTTSAPAAVSAMLKNNNIVAITDDMRAAIDTVMSIWGATNNATPARLVPMILAMTDTGAGEYELKCVTRSIRPDNINRVYITGHKGKGKTGEQVRAFDTVGAIIGNGSNSAEATNARYQLFAQLLLYVPAQNDEKAELDEISDADALTAFENAIENDAE